MIDMLCTEKKQGCEQKPEWHSPLGGGAEMPEKCNNIIYDYIMLFKCITCFTKYMNNIMHISGEKEQYGVSHRNKKSLHTEAFLFHERQWKIGMVSSSFPTSCDRGRDTTNPYDRF